MELFTDGEEYSFSQILEHSGLPRSTVSHLLDSLCEERLLVKSKRGVYLRGERLLQFCGQGGFSELRRICSSCCIMARDMLDELAVVGIRQGISRITIAKIQPKRNIQVVSESDAKYPSDWYGTGNGRILLAYTPREILMEIVRKCELPDAHIWKKASSMPKLEKELAQIREQGFVKMTLANEVKILAVPVRDCAGECQVSLSAAIPLYRNPLTDKEIWEKLCYCASRLEKELQTAGIRINELQYKGTSIYSKISNEKSHSESFKQEQTEFLSKRY